MMLFRDTVWYVESDVVLATGMDEDSSYPDYQGAEFDIELAFGLATRAADFAPRRSTGTRIRSGR